jgi:hypothetical protein
MPDCRESLQRGGNRMLMVSVWFVVAYAVLSAGWGLSVLVRRQTALKREGWL